jgi:hypothetical protein
VYWRTGGERVCALWCAGGGEGEELKDCAVAGSERVCWSEVRVWACYATVVVGGVRAGRSGACFKQVKLELRGRERSAVERACRQKSRGRREGKNPAFAVLSLRVLESWAPGSVGAATAGALC